MEIVSATAAVELIQDGWRVISGGFGCCGAPDTLLNALGDRFERSGHPQSLRLLFASGTGDKQGRGLDRLARPGLVREAVGGFWGFCPQLTQLAQQGLIEAHNWPQGVISKLFSAIGAGESELRSRIGLGTFIDPRLEGGAINAKDTPLVRLDGSGAQERLIYPALRPDCCLLRGTSADSRGNISMARETSYMDAVAQAIAVKNSGGIVIVQVEKIVQRHDSLAEIKIPGMLVDYAVVSECGHPATYGKVEDVRFTQTSKAPVTDARQTADTGLEISNPVKRRIVKRAFEELKAYRASHINLGIGIPALLGAHAKNQGLDDLWMTIESGTVGGIPEEGLAFGATVHPEAIMEQPVLFDFYHGGGIAAAFLGFGEVDLDGNVNVSRFADRLPGAGGFINISQSTKNVIFCGTSSTGGLELEENDGKVRILKEGKTPKIVRHVQQITFSAARARVTGQNVLYITERAVFRLGSSGLELVETYPGISAEQLKFILPEPASVRLAV